MLRCRWVLRRRRRGLERPSTDSLLSALARLRHRPAPPLTHHTHKPRAADGRHQASKIQSPRPSSDLSTGVEAGMTVAGSPERLAGSALRRLHYQATRRQHASARHASNKVVVMGGSSEHTANTSTESAATAVTSVTGTDESTETEPLAPGTAPPSYHRAPPSTDLPSPPAKSQSAGAAPTSPGVGPSHFIFDLPIPEPKQRNKTQVSVQQGSTNQLEPIKSPKVVKHETHFDFNPPSTSKRRSSEPRTKKREKDKEHREEGKASSGGRRRSSTQQHSVPPTRTRRQSVHVTTNPLHAAAAIPAGRTTIVVQQPSLSLDYGGCSTLLLRENGVGEDGMAGGNALREGGRHHLQQLLDVTSHFTTEDLHDFDKRYGSPHHSRSQSVKAARSRGAAGERQLLGLPQQRARVASMPSTCGEEEYYRLRHFSITGKGVVNRGDSLRSRRSRSNTSVASSASSTEPSAPCSLASSRDSSAGMSAYRVVVLGAAGVGKSSLVGQLLTSEYLHAYDTSIDDESGERSVCVLLAGEESEITFLDNPQADYEAHGYCVVYSSADRDSFHEAERRLQGLWAAGHTARRAVILVANKADLVRSRAVSIEEGKCLASSYECKFIETSVGINHNVDELLVGLLTQIRLKQQHADRAKKRSGPRQARGRARSPLPLPPPPETPASAASTPRKRTRLSASVKVRGLLGRVWARDSKSRSCDNLHVL